MSLASPFLYKGMTLAILKSLITLPVEREKLNICESAIIILSVEDFSNLSEISSKPALSFGLLFINRPIFFYFHRASRPNIHSFLNFVSKVFRIIIFILRKCTSIFICNR